jgi:hypothetical protein
MPTVADGETTSGSKVPATLDYARPASRLWHWVRVGLIACLITVAACGVAYRKRVQHVWVRSNVAYWRYRCRTHLDPAGSMVYDDDPDRFAQSRRDHPEFLNGPPNTYLIGRKPLFRPLPAVDRYESYAGTKLVDNAANPVLFMHELKTPEGKPVLVTIQMVVIDSQGWFARPTDFLIGLWDADTFEEGKWFGCKLERDLSGSTLATSATVRFHAATLTAGDPCACRIPFDSGKVHGVYEFRLKPGDVTGISVLDYSDGK